MKKPAAEPYREFDFSIAKRGTVIAPEPGKTKISIRLEPWHNEIDPAYGERMGTYCRSFVIEEARTLGFTLDDLRAWKLAATAGRRGRRRSATAPEG